MRCAYQRAEVRKTARDFLDDLKTRVRTCSPPGGTAPKWPSPVMAVPGGRIGRAGLTRASGYQLEPAAGSTLSGKVSIRLPMSPFGSIATNITMILTRKHFRIGLILLES